MPTTSYSEGVQSLAMPSLSGELEWQLTTFNNTATTEHGSCSSDSFGRSLTKCASKYTERCRAVQDGG